MNSNLALYDAEKKVRNLRAWERFETIPEVTSWVQQIVQSTWWKTYQIPVMDPTVLQYTDLTNYGTPSHTSIKVRDGRGSLMAWGYSFGAIALPKWARAKLIILHELAHTIQTEEPSHGCQFARIYLDLVRRWLGREVYRELRDFFLSNKVGFSRSHKLQWNP